MWLQGQEEQGKRGRLGGDSVFQRENAHNTISAEIHLETPCLLFPKCTIIKDSLGMLHNKGTRMVDKLLLFLWCHCMASGDIAKPSLLSKEGGNLEMSPAHLSTCIGHRTKS